MIDITKTYRTRNGREVRIYTTQGANPEWPVVGETLEQDGAWHENHQWHAHQWNADGCSRLDSQGDLVPLGKGEFITWGNVYLYTTTEGGMVSFHFNKNSAESCVRPAAALAAIPFRVTVDGDNVTIVQIKENP